MLDATDLDVSTIFYGNTFGCPIYALRLLHLVRTCSIGLVLSFAVAVL